MATQNKNLSLFNKVDIPNAKGMRVGIVVSEWNKEITSNLLKGAKETLIECGVVSSDIISMDVPGSFELVYGAKIMAKSNLRERQSISRKLVILASISLPRILSVRVSPISTPKPLARFASREIRGFPV